LFLAVNASNLRFVSSDNPLRINSILARVFAILPSSLPILAQAQGAMALLQGVQELANIATTEGALRTMVLDGAQKTAAVSARLMGTSIAGATAVATAGVSLLVIGLVALVSYLNDTSDDVG